MVYANPPTIRTTSIPTSAAIVVGCCHGNGCTRGENSQVKALWSADTVTLSGDADGGDAEERIESRIGALPSAARRVLWVAGSTTRRRTRAERRQTQSRRGATHSCRDIRKRWKHSGMMRMAPPQSVGAQALYLLRTGETWSLHGRTLEPTIVVD